MIHGEEAAVAETVREWSYDAIRAEGLDPRRYEVADGALVERLGMSGEGGQVSARLAHLLERWLDTLPDRPGRLFVGGRYLLRRTPRCERVPDLSYLLRERVPAGEDWPFPVAPDLAVEVRSPNDSVTELKRKLERDYFAGGTREAWIVDPDLQTITVLRPGGPPRSYDRSRALESDLLPGLSLDLEELFRVLDGP